MIMSESALSLTLLITLIYLWRYLFAATLMTASLPRLQWVFDPADTLKLILKQIVSYGERWTMVPSGKIVFSLPSGSKYLMVWSGNKISLFPPGCLFSVAVRDILVILAIVTHCDLLRDVQPQQQIKFQTNRSQSDPCSEVHNEALPQACISHQSACWGSEGPPDHLDRLYVLSVNQHSNTPAVHIQFILVSQRKNKNYNINTIGEPWTINIKVYLL